VAGRVSSAFNRVSQVAGYGYQPEVGPLSRLLKNYKDNGGIPDLLFDAGLSVNYNLFTATATLSTQTVTLRVGTFTFGFVSGAGSITSSNGIGIATGHGSATAGSNITITVTVAGTFTFTVSGAVNSAQLNVGSTLLSYRARTDATAVKPLNLGTLGASGDGTFVNGTALDFFSNDATAGNIINFNSASTLVIPTTYSSFSQMNNGVRISFWRKSGINANARIVTNSNFDANSRLEINEFAGIARFRIMSSSTAYYQAEGSGANGFTANTWEKWEFIWNGTLSDTSLIVRRNGITLSTTNTTVGSPTAITDGGTLTIGANTNGSNPYKGLLNAVLYDVGPSAGSVTADQSLNVFNQEKAQYGL
jgi:hypothetical protein